MARRPWAYWRGDRHVFVRVYKQYVRPHVEFATPAWAPWAAADIECLEDVQRRAVRMISGLGTGSYEEKLAELGMTTLSERRHQADMLQMYKILHGLDKVSPGFQPAATGERSTRATADPLNVKVPFARLEIRRNFFTVRAPTLWNNIPADIKDSRNPEQFKYRYRKFRSTALDGAQGR